MSSTYVQDRTGCAGGVNIYTQISHSVCSIVLLCGTVPDFDKLSWRVIRSFVAVTLFRLPKYPSSSSSSSLKKYT